MDHLVWVRNQSRIVKHLNIAEFGKCNEKGRILWKEKRMAYYEVEHKSGKLNSAKISI